MTNRNRVADVLLRYKVDKRSVSDADRANQRQIRSLDELIKKGRQFGSGNVDNTLRANAKAATDAAKAYDRAADNATRLATAQDRFDSTSRNVALAGDVQSNLGALSGLAGAAGAGGVSAGISGAGELVVLLEELPRLKTALTGLPQTAKAAASALGPTGLALGGAVVAIGVAAAIAARRIERAQQVLKGTTDAFREFERFRLDATTDEARAKLEDLEKELQSVNSTLATLQRAGQAAAETNPALGALITRFGGYAETIRGLEDEQQVLTQQVGLYTGALENNVFAVGDAAAQVERYNAAIANEANLRIQTGVFLADASTTTEQLNSRLQALQSEIELTGNEIENNVALQAEDRTALIERYNALQAEKDQLLAGRGAVDQRTRALELQSEIEENSKNLIEANARAQEIANRERLQGINDQVNREKEFAKLNREATTGTTADRLTALRDEQAALQSLISELQPIAGDSEDFAQALANARDDLRQVNADIERTFGEVAPAAIGRLRDEIQQERSAARADRDSAIRDAGLDRARGLEEAAATLQEGLADLDRDFAKQQTNFREETAQELEQFQRDERDRVRDHQSELARIQRDSQDTIQDAALSLDAGAIRRAQRQRDRQLEDQQERFERESEQAQERLELIKKEAQAERREIIQNYQERRRDLIEANRQTVNDLNRRYQAEIQTANNAYRAQVDLLSQKLQAETRLIQQAYSAQLSGAQQFAQQSANILQQQQSALQQAAADAQRAAAEQAGRQRVQSVVQGVASTGIGGSLSNIFGGLLGFADGGRVPYDGIFRLHRDEIVLNNAQQRAVAGAMQGGRSISFSPNIVVNGNLDNVTLDQVDSRLNIAFNQFVDMVGT